MRKVFQVIVMVAGLSLVVALITGVSKNWAKAGLGLLLIGALLCFLVSLEGHRLVQIAFGKRVDIRLTQELDAEVADTTFGNVAATYAFVHNQLGRDDRAQKLKIELQDRLVEIARENAFTSKFDAGETRKAIMEGTPAERVLAFGLLAGDTSLANKDLLEHGIRQPRSGNEQYHALLATKAAWPTLNSSEQHALRAAIRQAPYIRDDPDRYTVAEEIIGGPLDQS
jgi:hypothetical protein